MVKNVRGESNTRLHRWEATARALDAQLNKSRIEVLERLEREKAAFREVTSRLSEHITQSLEMPSDVKTKLIQEADNLQIQLALGKSEVRKLYETQRKSILNAIQVFEACIDGHLKTNSINTDETSNILVRLWIKNANVIEAELNAAQAQFMLDRARRRKHFELKKQALNERIKKFRDRIEMKRNIDESGLSKLERQLSIEITQVKRAFRRLLN